MSAVETKDSPEPSGYTRRSAPQESSNCSVLIPFSNQWQARRRSADRPFVRQAKPTQFMVGWEMELSGFNLGGADIPEL